MSIGYQNNFEEICAIGAQNAITTIFEARSLTDNKRYAIKKIPFNVKDENAIVNEIKLLSRLNKAYVARFVDIWVESNYYISNSSRFYTDTNNIVMSPDKQRLMHIQMNLYALPLDRVTQLLNYSNANVISPKKYSIASEIFLQLVECVQYLHTNDPPIVHKNLKSENIMLTADSDNRNVKLTDFGLSTYYDVVNEWHSTRKGIKSNAPPEVNRIIYTAKTDMYSLGIIMKELFNIDIEKKFPVITSKIQSHYGIIRNICLKCLSPTAGIRPSCEEILNSKDAWLYSIPKTKNLLCEINKLEIKNQVNAEEKIKEIVSSGGSSHTIQKQRSIDKPMVKNLTADDIGLPYNFVHVMHIGPNFNNNTQLKDVNVNNENENSSDKEKQEESGSEEVINSVTSNIDETHYQTEGDKQEILDSLQTEDIAVEQNATNATVVFPLPRKRIASKDSTKLTNDETQVTIECKPIIQNDSNEEVFETESHSLQSDAQEEGEEERSEVYRIESDSQTSLDMKDQDINESIDEMSIAVGVKQNEKQNINIKPIDDKKLTTTDIGLPYNFVHVLHIGNDFNNNNNSDALKTPENDINILNDKEKLAETYNEKLLQSQSVSDETLEKPSVIEFVTHEPLIECADNTVIDIINCVQTSEPMNTLNECEQPTNDDNKQTDTETSEFEEQAEQKEETSDDKQSDTESDVIISDEVLADDSQSAIETIIVNETPKSVSVPPQIYPRKSKVVAVKEFV